MKKKTTRELENLIYISFYCLNINLSSKNLINEKQLKNKISTISPLYENSHRILTNPVNKVTESNLYNYHIFLQRFSFIYKKINMEYNKKLTEDEIRLEALRSLEIIRNFL
jgi:hypothetical protein|tara:strand:- start:2932 stop:3264 length:333 start_codon:yes stop_codon:yes gene_type:complete